MSTRILAPLAILTLATHGWSQQQGPPADGLVLWLAADADVECDGHLVTLWRDQSPHGNHARARATLAPTLDPRGPGGKPWVCFDGARTHMLIDHAPELNVARGFSALCVYRHTGGFRIAQKKSNSGGLTPDAWFLTPHGGLGVSGKYIADAGVVHGTDCLLASVFDAEEGTLKAYNNGEPEGTLSSVPRPEPNRDPLYLGKRLLPQGTEGHLQGGVSELLIYSIALPDADRRRAEDYLRDKYGIKRRERPLVEVTRVIPGDARVTVDWLVPPALGPDVRYTVAVKLRDEEWGRARTLTVPAPQTSARVTGLMNRADHTVRVTAQRASDKQALGGSAERLFTPGEVPGVVIDYIHRADPAYARLGNYVGSPSIARLKDGRLVASHDLFGRSRSNRTRVFGSDDAGQTWYHLAEVEPAFWGTLFVHDEALYLLACRHAGDDIVLHRSLDGGSTWQEPVVLAAGAYHKAPVPVLRHRGRLWICVEHAAGAWASGFEAVALSVPVTADLMDPAAWTVSEPLPYDPEWLPEGWDLAEGKHGFLEGNAVAAPDGTVLNILRYHIAPKFGKAIVLNVSEDGRRLSFDSIIDFSGGITKFTIRRDPDTGRYWSLVNRIVDPAAQGRQVLSLVWSDDLWEWNVSRDLLRDDRPFAARYTGFQYVDWLLDGDDIIFVSRTALNGAHNFHDANYLTFHRVHDYCTDAVPHTVGAQGAQ